MQLVSLGCKLDQGYSSQSWTVCSQSVWCWRSVP